MFDYVYHDHFSYFTSKSLSSLAKRCGLFIKSWSVSNLRGGSFRAQLCPASSETVDTVTLPYERFALPIEFKSFINLITYSRLSILDQLLDAKSFGFECVGYGASHSTGILVHTFGLAPYLDFLVDDNVLKHSRYMPGTPLKVEPPSRVYYSEKIVVVILACQYFEQIQQKLTSSGFKGLILTPVLP